MTRGPRVKAVSTETALCVSKYLTSEEFSTHYSPYRLYTLELWQMIWYNIRTLALALFFVGDLLLNSEPMFDVDLSSSLTLSDEDLWDDTADAPVPIEPDEEEDDLIVPKPTVPLDDDEMAADDDLDLLPDDLGDEEL